MQGPGPGQGASGSASGSGSGSGEWHPQQQHYAHPQQHHPHQRVPSWDHPQQQQQQQQHDFYAYAYPAPMQYQQPHQHQPQQPQPRQPSSTPISTPPPPAPAQTQTQAQTSPSSNQQAAPQASPQQQQQQRPYYSPIAGPSYAWQPPPQPFYPYGAPMYAHHPEPSYPQPQQQQQQQPGAGPEYTWAPEQRSALQPQLPPQPQVWQPAPRLQMTPQGWYAPAPPLQQQPPVQSYPATGWQSAPSWAPQPQLHQQQPFPPYTSTGIVTPAQAAENAHKRRVSDDFERALSAGAGKKKKAVVEADAPRPIAHSSLHPPRQAASAWQLFFTDTLNAAKAAHKATAPSGDSKLNVAHIAREAGLAYANMTPEQKDYYATKVQESKQQYAKELAAWQATLTPDDIRAENAFRAQQRKEGKSRKGNLKDPNAPKKPLSAYFLYLKTIRENAELRKDVWGDELGTTKQSVLAAKRWRALTDVEKHPYLAQADKDKMEYEIRRRAYEEDAAARARALENPHQYPLSTSASTSTSIISPIPPTPSSSAIPPLPLPLQQEGTRGDDTQSPSIAEADADFPMAPPPPGPGPAYANDGFPAFDQHDQWQSQFADFPPMPMSMDFDAAPEPASPPSSAPAPAPAAMQFAGNRSVSMGVEDFVEPGATTGTETGTGTGTLALDLPAAVRPAGEIEDEEVPTLESENAQAESMEVHQPVDVEAAPSAGLEETDVGSEPTFESTTDAAEPTINAVEPAVKAPEPLADTDDPADADTSVALISPTDPSTATATAEPSATGIDVTADISAQSADALASTSPSGTQERPVELIDPLEEPRVPKVAEETGETGGEPEQPVIFEPSSQLKITTAETAAEDTQSAVQTPAGVAQSLLEEAGAKQSAPEQDSPTESVPRDDAAPKDASASELVVRSASPVELPAVATGHEAGADQSEEVAQAQGESGAVIGVEGV